MTSSRRDADRLLPADPAVRQTARELYDSVRSLPIISPHGHVPAALLAENRPFTNAAELFVSHDHYVTRVLHSAGVDLGALGVGGIHLDGSGFDVRGFDVRGFDAREAWRLLASNWHLFAGTASGYWLDEELTGVLGVELEVSAATADDIYDQVDARLSTPEFSPRALFERFGIEFLATTDDPLDDLEQHDALRSAGLGGTVAPTFRPDRYLDPDARGFAEAVDQLLARTAGPSTFAGYLSALEQRRRFFIEHGAVSADHGVLDAFTLDLEPGEAERLFQSVLAGNADAVDRRAFRGHMLLQSARMSVDDGLVMTVHAGVLRNHSTATFERFGPDTGHDIPVTTTFTRELRPLLEKYGLERQFHLVLFTVDETAYSREIAPLAGFYPSVYIGAPWWFLDAPDAMARFRAATVETAGFYRSSGFIDDTRAFLSIPARHDTARRVDAGVLARLVHEGRVTRAAAETIAHDLVASIPTAVFKL